VPLGIETSMWFILRMTFWIGGVLVLLSNVGSQTTPDSQVSVKGPFSAAKDAMTDFEHFCERQHEACVVGSRTAVTLGKRAKAGFKILYELLRERLGDASRSARTTPSGVQ
jgi:hypothetical protein